MIFSGEHRHRALDKSNLSRAGMVPAQLQCSTLGCEMVLLGNGALEASKVLYCLGLDVLSVRPGESDKRGVEALFFLDTAGFFDICK
jgi:hypothetical protein